MKAIITFTCLLIAPTLASAVQERVAVLLREPTRKALADPLNGGVAASRLPRPLDELIQGFLLQYEYSQKLLHTSQTP